MSFQHLALLLGLAPAALVHLAAAGAPVHTRTAITSGAAVTAPPQDAVPSRVKTLDVASGPTSNFEEVGTYVIRSDDEWADFWKHLPTRQEPPDIDFERVTLLAVVLDPEPDAHAVPRIDDARGRGSELVVRWRAAKEKRPGNVPSTADLHPFVVVGIMDYGGPVVFEQRR